MYIVIDMALCNTAESTVAQAKRRTVLEDWDKRREIELGDDAGPWEVLYCSTGKVRPVFFVLLFLPFSRLFVSRDPLKSIALRSKDDTSICAPRRSNASSQM